VAVQPLALSLVYLGMRNGDRLAVVLEGNDSPHFSQEWRQRLFRREKEGARLGSV
jgi:hypothetical protein